MAAAPAQSIVARARFVLRASFVAFALLGMSAATLHATPKTHASKKRAVSTLTWSGLGADANWMTPANWVGGVAPVAGDNLVFDATGIVARPTANNNFPAGTVFGSIAATASGSAGAYTLSGNSVSLTTGFTTGTSSLTNVNLSITGPGSFISNGGRTSLAGTNTFTGGFFLNDGSVYVTTSASAGSGTVFLGDPVNANFATLTLGNITLSRPIVLNAGPSTPTIESDVGASATLSGGITGSNSVILTTHASPSTLIVSTNPINNAGTVTASPQSGTITWSAAIGSNVTKLISVGNVTISGAVNVNSTGTRIENSGGDLILSGGVVGTGNLTTANQSSGTLTIQTGSVNNVGTVTNSGTGSGAVTIASVIGTNVTGVLQNSTNSNLVLSGANTFTSGLTVQAGSAIALTTSSAFGAGTITLGVASTSTAASALIGTAGLNITRPVVVTGGATGVLSIGISDNVSATWSGGVTGSNNIRFYNSNVINSSGTLTVSSGLINNSGTITTAGGAAGLITISAPIGSNVSGVTHATTPPLTLSGAITVGSGGFTLTKSAANATTFSGTISGTGNVTFAQLVSGTFTIGGTINNVGTVSRSGSGIPTTFSGGIGSNVTDFIVTSTGSSISPNVVLQGTNTYASLTILAGRIDIASASALGSGSLKLGTGASSQVFYITAPMTIARPIVLGGTGTRNFVNATTGAVVFTGGVTGNGTLTINSHPDAGAGGTMTFSTGAINFAGAISNFAQTTPKAGLTTISSPIVIASLSFTLQTIGEGRMQVTGGVTGTGNLVLQNTNGVDPNAITVSGAAINHSGSLSHNSGNTTSTTLISAPIGTNVTQISLTGSGALNVTGQVTVNAAGTTLTKGSTSAQALTFSGGVVGTGNLILSHASTGTNTLVISGSGANPVGTITNSGAGTGSVLISGPIGTNVTGVVQNSTTSQLTLGAANTFTAGLSVLAGTVVGTTSANAFGAGGSITLGNTSGTSSAQLLVGTSGLTISRPIVLATGTTGALSIGAASTGISATFSGGITGSNNVTLYNNAAFTGGTGTLTFSTNSLDNAGTIHVTGNSTGATTISAPIRSNVTGITQNNPSGVLNITGALNVNAAGTTVTSLSAMLTTISGGVAGTGDLILKANSSSGVFSDTHIQVSSGTVNNAGKLRSEGTGVAQVLVSSSIGSNVTEIANSGTTSAFLVSGPITVSSPQTAFWGNATGAVLRITGTISGTGNVVAVADKVEIQFQTSTINNVGSFTNIGIGTNPVYVSSVIGTNVTSVVQNSATSLLYLQGANTFTGGLRILKGDVQGAFSTGALGAGTVTIGNTSGSNDARLIWAGSGAPDVISRPIVLATGTTGKLSIAYANNGTVQFSGGLTGNNNLTVENGTFNYTGTLAFTTNSVNNAGTVTVTGLSSGSTSFTSGIGSNVTGVINNSTAGNAVVSGNLSVNSSGTALRTTTTKTLTLSGAISGTGNVNLENNSTTASGVALTGTTNPSGVITNAGTGTGSVAISGNVGSSVTGIVQNSSTSRLELSGASNTLTSGVTIRKGTLVGLTNGNVFGTGGNIRIGDTSGGNSATLLVGTTGLNITRPIVLETGTTGTLIIGNTNAIPNLTFSGGVSGANNLTINNGNSAGSIVFSGYTDNAGTVTSVGIGYTNLLGGVGPSVTEVINNAPAATGGLNLGGTTAAGKTLTNSNTSASVLSLAGAVTGTGDLTLKNNSSLVNGIQITNSGFTFALNQIGKLINSGTGTGTVVISGPIHSNVTDVIQNSATSFIELSGQLNVRSGGTTLRDVGGAGIYLSGGTTGTGNLVLENNNQFNGAFAIGSAAINHIGSLTNAGTGTGNLQIVSDIGANVTGVIQNSASSPLALIGAKTFGSGITIRNGTVVTGSSPAALGTGSVTLGHTSGSTNATLHLDFAGTYANPIVLAAGGTGARLIRGTNSVPVTISGGISGANDLTVFSESATMTLGGTLAWTGSLSKTGTGTLSLASPVSLGGDLTISGGTFIAPSGMMTVGGNWTNAGTFTHNNGTVKLNGASSQTIGGTNTFNNLTIDGVGVSLNSSPIVDGILTFVNGKITTSSRTLTVGASGSITGAGAARYVFGNLQRRIPNAAAPSVEFPIGDASTYAPVIIAFAGSTTGSGSLLAFTTAGDHPDIVNSGVSASKSANRFWTLTNSGVAGFTSYDGTFTFAPADLDAGATPSNFIVAKKSGSVWAPTTVGSRTSTTTQATGLTDFSDFQIGEVQAATASIQSTTPASLSEANLNNATIVVDITDATYGATLAASDFSLATAPTGTTIGSVTRNSATRATLTLAFNGTDFDTNSTVSVTVNQTALATGTGPATTGTQVVTARLEVAAAIQSTAPASLSETNLNGAQIVVDLTDGTFNPSIAASDFSLGTAPTGATIGSVSRTSATRATLTLAFNGTDFDTNSTVSVTVTQTALATGTGPATTGTQVVTARLEVAAAIQSTTPATLSETNLNGAQIVVDLTDGTFNPSIAASDFALATAPTGTTIGSVARNSATRATLTLTFNGTDFDTNGTVSVTVNQTALATGTGPATTGTQVVTARLEVAAAIQSTTPASLSETNLNGASIVVDLTDGTFNASIAASDFALATAPTGTTIGSVARNSATRATLTLTFNGTDFDTNSTVSVTVNQTALATGTGPATTGTQVVTARLEVAVAIQSTTPASLSETNLNGAQIVVDLTDGTFNPSIAASDFSLATAPTGTTIGSVARNSATRATLTLAFNGTDFDTNSTVSVTVNQTALATGTGPATTGTQVVTARLEVAAAIQSTTPASLSETNLNSAQIVVDLTDGTFNPSIAASDFALATAPTGTTIGSVARNSATRATLTFAFNGTDFDTNSTVSVTVNQTGLATGTGPATTGTQVVTARLEVAAAIQSTAPASLSETNLNGAQIVVDLTDGTFNPSIAASDFALATAPTGTTIGSVTRNSATRATLTLAFDGTDFDTNSTVSVTVNQTALATGTGPATTGTQVVTARLEVAAAIQSTTPASLSETNLNGAQIVIDLTDGTFNPSIAASDFMLATAPTGTTIGSVARNSATRATLTLAFNGTDFDTNSTVSVTVNQTGLATGTGAATTGTQVVTARLEVAAAIQSTTPASLSETNLNGAQIVVDLTDGTFNPSIAASDFSLATAPTGTTIGGVTRNSATRATLTLAFNGTDFDTNSTVSVTVNQTALATGTGPATTGTQVVTARLEVAAAIQSTTPASLSETNLNGAQVVVDLTDGTFNPSIAASDFALATAPAGTTIGSVTRNSATRATLTLAFNGSDFDTNSTVSVTVNQTALATGTGPATTGTQVVTARLEVAAAIQSTTPASLSETNLNGAQIVVDLTDGTFNPSIAASDFGLATAPSGTTIGSVARNSATRATLTLAFNGADFDTNSTVSVTVNQTALATGTGPATTGTQVVTARLEVAAAIQSTTPASLSETNLNGASIVVDLTDGTFNPSIAASDFVLATAPTGTTIGSVARNSATRATLTLAFNGTDFDTNTTVSVTVNQTALATGTGPATTGTQVVTARLEVAAAIQSTTPASLSETNLNGASIVVDLTDGTFNPSIAASDFSLASAPTGTTIGSVSRTSATRATLTVAFNGTDFDTNSTVSVTVNQTGLATGTGPATTGTQVVTARLEVAAAIQSTTPASLSETTLNGAQIVVDLTDGTFNPSIAASDFALATAPTGTTIGGVTRNSATRATVTLAFNGTDFDTNSTVSVAVNQTALATGTGPATTGTEVVTARLEVATAIQSTTPASLSETNLNGAQIVVDLTDGTFNPSIAASDFVLATAPSGTTIGGVARNSATRATLTLAFDGTDFDTNSTISVTVNQTALATGTGPATTGTQVVTARLEVAVAIQSSIPASLSETNLNGAQIVVDLTDGTFNPSIGASDFTVATAPTGTTIGSVSRTSATRATLTLAFDGTDFDTNSTVAVTVNQTALATGTGPATTGTQVVTARLEVAAAIQSTTPASLSETNLNGAQIVVDLTDGTFNPSIAASDLVLATAPSGTTIGSVARNSATRATLTLAFNGTDFDANSTVSVTVNQTGLATGTGPATTGTQVVTARLEVAAAIQSTTPASLSETNLNGAQIVVDLTDGTFNPSIAASDFVLATAPTGTTIGGVTRTSAIRATLTLAFNGTDFDANSTVSVTVSQAALATGTGPATTGTQAVSARLEVAAAIQSTTPASLSETNLIGASIVVDLTDGTFNPSISASDFALATAPTGTTIGGVTRNSATEATLTLAFDGTDFDTNSTVSVTVNQTALATGTGPATTGTQVVTARLEVAVAIQSTTPASLSEANLNGAQIVVDLTDGTFNPSIAASDFVLATAPPGTTIGSVARNSATRATLTLAFDGTDFDTNSMVSATVLQSALATGTGPATTGTAAVTARLEVAAAIQSTSPASLSETNLNGATVVVDLTDGTYGATLAASDFALATAPTGTTIASVTRNSATRATLTLAFNGTDFDTNSTVSATVLQSALATGTGPATTGTAAVTARLEVAAAIQSTNPASLSETNVNGATIAVDLTDGTYNTTLSPSDFTLATSPNGTTIAGVTRNSATRATLTLAFNGTDFDTNTTVSVTVNQSALATGTGPATTGTAAVTARLEVAAAIQSTTPVSLSETNLNGATIVVDLTDGTFNSAITATDFTLASSPAGTTIGSVTRNTATRATLTLAFNGTDFDTSTTLSATVLQSALASGTGPATTGTVPVTAVVEVVSVAVSVSARTNPEALTEANLNGANVIVTLTGSTYVGALAPGNFALNNAVSGISILNVTRNSATEAMLTLGFNGADFDAETRFTVSVLASANVAAQSATTTEVVVTPTAATRVDFDGPANANQNAVSTAFTITAIEPNGTPMTVRTAQAFRLTTNSGGPATFWANPNGTSAVTTVLIAAGAQSVSFFYQDAAGGAHTITAASDALGTATRTITTQVIAAPVALGFGTLPTVITAERNMTPALTVRALNSTGGLDASFADEVTLELLAGPAGATLLGNTRARAVQGVATFSDVRFSTPGAGYVIRASAPGMTPVTSSPLTAAAGAVGLTATITSSNNHPVEGDTVTITVTLSNTSDFSAVGLIYNVPIPARMTFVRVTPSAGTYNSAAGTWNVGSIAARGAATLQLTVVVR